MKLPAYTATFLDNEISFLIVPHDPAYQSGFSGHFPSKRMAGDAGVEPTAFGSGGQRSIQLS